MFNTNVKYYRNIFIRLNFGFSLRRYSSRHYSEPGSILLGANRHFNFLSVLHCRPNSQFYTDVRYLNNLLVFQNWLKNSIVKKKIRSLGQIFCHKFHCNRLGYERIKSRNRCLHLIWNLLNINEHVQLRVNLKF